MNWELYHYCRRSQKRPEPSRAGETIARVLSEAERSGVPDDADLLALLIQSLAETPTLDDAAFCWLKPLHGCGGSEGYVLGVEPAIEAEFWSSLAKKYPSHQGLAYLAADSALLAGANATARRFFMHGFRMDPSTPPAMAVDWEDELRGTDWHFEYRLLLLVRTRRYYPDELIEEVDELAALFGDDAEKLRLIHEVADGGDVPQFQ
ncbi:MAG TPA: hypothetical protein VHC19_01685 [Pirellulales bacterium]|nr:hypothetical protein [Pirellulales bacterium]